MKVIAQACLMLLILTVLTGVAYPAFVTIVAQAVWSEKSNGSLVTDKDRILGSALIAQGFKEDRYFWPRPSASDYVAIPSGASNLAPTSLLLKTKIKERRAKIALAHGVSEDAVPEELITASASGLDPHLSLAGAQFQIERVAKARNFTEAQKTKLQEQVALHVERAQWGVFGGARINVLALNRALDAI